VSVAQRRRRSLTFVLILLNALIPLVPSTKAGAFPDTCNENIFYSEDHDDGSAWTSPVDYNGPSQYELAWQHSSEGTSHSGSHHWYIHNYGQTTEARLESPEIDIPEMATEELFLRFYHAYDTNGGDDGGIIEVKVNGAEFVDVGASSFILHGYPRSFSGAATVLGIREAFTGLNAGFPGYVESIVNLSSFAESGDSITIRFRFASDDHEAGNGWFVDDVELGYCGKVNTPPSASDLPLSTLEDTAVNGAITAADADEDTLTFSLASVPANGSAVVNIDGSLTYTPNLNFNGNDSFTAAVDDGNGGSAAATVNITVTAVNDPPVMNDLNTSTPEDTTLDDAITAADADSSTLTFALDTQAAHGIASVHPDGSFSYTPSADFAGIDTFVVSVSDGSGAGDTATVTVDVGSVSDNPVVSAGADQIATLDAVVSINAVFTDADSGDTHSATIDWGDGSTLESVIAASGNVSGSHVYTRSGSFTVIVAVWDSGGGNGSDTLIISVDAPTLTPTQTPTPTATSTQETSGTLTPTASPSITPTFNISPTVTSASVTTTPDVPPPPPAPLAAEVNADPAGIVRVGLPDALSSDIHIREIVVNGEYPSWHGGATANGGFIGSPGVLDMGVQQAVDVFSPSGLTYFEGGIVVCLRGAGTLVYLNASYAPRIAEIVGSYTVPEFPGFTCVTLFEPGTLALVDSIQ
jgi:VCBS repeat-containing protein